MSDKQNLKAVSDANKNTRDIPDESSLNNNLRARNYGDYGNRRNRREDYNRELGSDSYSRNKQSKYDSRNNRNGPEDSTKDSPYMIDLGSTNGTFINGTQIPAQRYVELLSQDVIKFGFSTREYVLIKV
ncbi:hypothetical protein BB560_005566, partial [Smittium megazygosporum]